MQKTINFNEKRQKNQRERKKSERNENITHTM